MTVSITSGMTSCFSNNVNMLLWASRFADVLCQGIVRERTLCSSFPKSRTFFKSYRSVRQPGYLPLVERPIGIAPPPHDGFAFIAALSGGRACVTLTMTARSKAVKVLAPIIRTFRIPEHKFPLKSWRPSCRGLQLLLRNQILGRVGSDSFLQRFDSYLGERLRTARTRSWLR